MKYTYKFELNTNNECNECDQSAYHAIKYEILTDSPMTILN